jgi:hypothetical protein
MGVISALQMIPLHSRCPRCSVLAFDRADASDARLSVAAARPLLLLASLPFGGSNGHRAARGLEVLGLRPRVWPPESPRNTGPGPSGLGSPVPGRTHGHEAVDEAAGNLRNVLHSLSEGRLVRLGRRIEATQLPHELEGRSADFLVRRRRLEIEEGSDVPAHGPGPPVPHPTEKAPRRLASHSRTPSHEPMPGKRVHAEHPKTDRAP